MTEIDRILYQALIKKDLAGADKLDLLVREAESSFQPLTEVILKHGIIPEKSVLELLSGHMGIPVVDVKTISVEKSVISRVPPKIVYYYKFLPLNITDGVLTIAVACPPDVKTQDEIRTQLGLDLGIVLAFSADIKEAQGKYYNVTASTVDKMASLIPKEAQPGQQPAADKVEDIEKLAGDASIIKLVNQIILEAWRKRSTDIHIEPYRQGVSLRYRVDGILYEENVPPQIKNYINAIISRIKIMSNLNIVERRLPQDGRAVVKVAEQVLDLRISTIPTPFGESLVIRILPTKMFFSLEKLGLSPKDQVVFESLISRPNGIIFVTGPTGSGKTTTLYTCLSRINTRDRKIITIEDPIEYEMSGITQIQVMPEIGLDFARGLRSILRHDPDVIMVGEVRDLETAEIAIRVALTGHLVFSTLHTNDAASGITRLIDIGVEPYLVASSVEAFIAQRLVRVICPDCKYEDTAAPVELKRMIARDLGLKTEDIKIYRGKGCSKCNFTGFFGRTAIYETIVIDEPIKELIIKKVPAGVIKKTAISRGMRTLAQDGWYKVILGFTTPEEVMRVASIDDHRSSEDAGDAALDRIPEVPEKDNRRAFTRLETKINLRYKVFRNQEDLASRGSRPEEFSISSNISAGGLSFVSTEALVFGSILELNIDLPSGQETVQCLARVVRITESDKKGMFEIGVCFLDLTGAQRAKLEQYVDKRAGKE